MAAVALTKTPENALISAAKTGDEKAIETLVLTYWPDAHRVAYLLLQDRGRAEDVAQEALLRVVRSLDAFEVGRPLRPWVCRIAANCAHDALRYARSRPQTVEDADAPLSAGDDDLADQIARAALSEPLQAALAALGEETREAVVLRHALDYSPEEIAEIAGVSPGTVRSRIHRGLIALRASLREDKETTDD
jgi:RNA polymerase sigma-70 factor (ECF subfamily)